MLVLQKKMIVGIFLSLFSNHHIYHIGIQKTTSGNVASYVNIVYGRC